jgi:hypothetical protein
VTTHFVHNTFSPSKTPLFGLKFIYLSQNKKNLYVRRIRAASPRSILKPREDPWIFPIVAQNASSFAPQSCWRIFVGHELIVPGFPPGGVSAYWFDLHYGPIHDVRIYDRALSNSEI